MVEKIIVNPLNVRGRGNILSPKSIEDFTVYNSSLSYVNGLYTMEYVASTVTVSLTASASSLNVGESIVLTATVLDDGTAVDGVTVSFTSGNLAIGTAVTGSDGVATLTTSTLTAGSHSIIATYGNAISSPVSVTVNKLTPTISIAKSGDVTVGTAYVISGTLSCSGSVKLYEDGSLIDTLTVSSGAFSKSITKSVTGNFSYYALFDGDSNYNSVTSSSVTVVVSDVAPSYDDIVLSADDSILSYYDGDSTTLRAQLMDGSSTASVSGVTVEFFKGSASLGTAQTDSNGVATKTYTSTGVGDISLTASDGTLVSETFSIEDCIDYDTLTSNHNKFTLTGSATTIYSSDGLSMKGTSSSTALYMYNGTIPTDYILEYDVVSFTIGAWDSSGEILTSHIGLSETKQSNVVKTRFMTFSNDYSSYSGYNDLTRVTPPYHLKIVVENGTATYYCDNVEIHSRSTGSTDMGFKAMNNRAVAVKNMKLKPL